MIEVKDAATANWIQDEKNAIDLLNTVTGLWYDKSVELVLFRKRIKDTRTSEIINHHLLATDFIDKPLPVEVSLGLAKAIANTDIAPSRIDIGRLSKEYVDSSNKVKDFDEFVNQQLGDHMGPGKIDLEPKDVVLYGFGRIGRLAARILIDDYAGGQQLRLKAIVTRGNSDEELLKRATLLRRDSVHGKFRGVVAADLDNKTLIVNGQVIHMISASNPAEIDYTEYGIDNALVIDNTGAWRDEEGLGQHLKAKGVSKVLLTAPGKGNIPNIVVGVNQLNFERDDHDIFSAASCTTNAIVPVLAAVNNAIGIEGGHIETVHAYTNDQNLLDNYHKKARRGRSAPLNMVITETGAASAVAKVLPELAGKLTGNAVRVPTPNVSLAILNLRLKKETSKDEINDVLRKATLEGDLMEQIEYSTSTEVVSSDLVGNTHASIVDAPATIVSGDGKSATIYAWYDNEYGYTRQVMRLAKHISRVRRLIYY